MNSGTTHEKAMKMARNLLLADKQVAHKEALMSLPAFARSLTSESDTKDGSMKLGRLYHLKERMSDQFQRFFTHKRKERIPVRNDLFRKKRLWDMYSECHSTTTSHSGDFTSSSTAFNGPLSSASSPWTKSCNPSHPGLSQSPSALCAVPGQFALPLWDGLTPLGFLPAGNESYVPAMQEPDISVHVPMNWAASHETDVGYMIGAGIAYPSPPERMMPILQGVSNSADREQRYQTFHSNGYLAGCSWSPSLLARQNHEVRTQGLTVATMMSTSPAASLLGEHYPIPDNAMSQYSSQFETSLPTPRSFFLSPGPSVVDFNPCEFSKSQMFKQDRF